MALEDIYHYEQVTDNIGSSGQPTADQFQFIKAAGFDAVINLALPDSDNAISDEGSIVTALDMSYFHIPVKFDNPTSEDLRTFSGVMQALGERRVWVHCVVNARVSAFLYVYLHRVLGLPEAECRTGLLDRWQPQMDEVWTNFLQLDAADLDTGPKS